MTWNVPNIWEGGECWIIGGGSSLTTQFNIPKQIVTRVREGKAPLTAYSKYLEPLHTKHTIGINGAFRLGNWIDVCFFGDKLWYFDNAADLQNYTGLLIGCPNFLKNPGWQQLKVFHVEQDESKPYGIHKDANKVCWNFNSGAASISIAYSLGCKRIILLGFDMQLVDGTSHWHNLYEKTTTDESFAKHLVGFDAIARDAKELGIEIINANPDSAITQFEKIPVKYLL